MDQGEISNFQIVSKTKYALESICSISPLKYLKMTYNTQLL